MTTIRCKLERAPRKGRKAKSTATSAPPSRVAGQLALAHFVERLIESGELESYAAAARSLGLTRARLAQVMRLLLLAPEIQERILAGELRGSERGLRDTVRQAEWASQIPCEASANPPSLTSCSSSG